jgi:uncharacterized protein (TIGR03437 family)
MVLCIYVDVIFRPLLTFFLLVAHVHAQSGAISIVSSASYRSVVAPDSLASIFGSGLARTTATATLDANGNLPVELANTRVEVNGVTAQLIFVSPTQINFVVPTATPQGANVVIVRSTDTNNTRTGSAQVAASAPAVFSSDGSGSGAGAILNAVTFAGAPFITVTIENGSDTRTRLAVYGTGFRAAKNVSATAVDPHGNRFSLVVEFAGPAPGFVGLDQLNVIVPAALDGAGAISLTVTTEDSVSNAVTFQMTLLPVSLLQLSSLTLTPAAVNAGDIITATIGLTGVARSGGFPVNLRTSNLAALPPSFATIPEGSATTNVLVNTSPVATVQIGAITAQSGNVSVSAAFEVDPQTQAQLAALSVIPVSTLGGRTLQGTIGLSAGAPAGGVIVQLASDSAAAQPPPAVPVLFNQTSASFAIPTTMVASPQRVTISATYNRVTLTSTVTLQPLFTLTIDPNPVIGGTTATGSITLAEPAPAGGANIALTSTDSTSARVPPFVSIAMGQNFGTFTITTAQVSGGRSVTISGLYLSVTESVVLTVTPPTAPTLSSIAISPDLVTGGQSTQGTVTLAAPAPVGGIRVDLSSSSLVVAQVPAFVTVPQGFTSAIFKVNTFPVPFAQTTTVTASAGGIFRSVVLTVQ